jgi:uncharacterized repeat protein (TIGR01451 family)
VKTDQTIAKRRVWTLLPVALALVLMVSLSLLLSHHRVQAQPQAPARVMTVHKGVNTATAPAGDRLTYTIHVQNAQANPIYDVGLTDTLPNELTFVTDSLTATAGTFGSANGVITWSFDLGVQAWITFSARISPETAATIIVNTAHVTGAGELITASAETALAIPASQLAASKSVIPYHGRSGEHLTYTVRITNIGDGAAVAVWMTDALPPEVSYVNDSLTATMGRFGEASGVITWHVTTDPSGSSLLFPPLEQAAVTFTVKVAPDTRERYSFTNTAEVTDAGTPVSASVETTVINTSTMWLPVSFLNYPPLPVLDDIPEPDTNNTYTVSWQFASPPVDQYVLQESTASDFNIVTAQWVTTDTHQLIQIGTGRGMRYYRVRADKAGLWGQGAWSEVRSVMLKTNYIDGFDDPSSGWSIHPARC